MDKLEIIIPAAGLGRRMKSYGPKSLIDLGNGELIIHRQLSILKKNYPEANITLIVGFDAEKIYKFLPNYVKVLKNEMYQETNVAHSINLGLNSINTDRILIVYGDLVFNDIFNNLKLDNSTAIIDNKCFMKDNEVGLTVIDNRVSQFSYGLDTKWGQIVYLTKKELELFRKFSNNKNHMRLYGFEILNMVLNHGGKINSIEPLGMKIIDVDTSKDIEMARSLIKE